MTTQAKLRRILREVSKAFDVPVKELTGRRGKQNVSDARFAFYWLARRFTKASLKQVGKFAGGRIHGTVQGGVLTCANIMGQNEGYRKKVMDLNGQLSKEVEL